MTRPTDLPTPVASPATDPDPADAPSAADEAGWLANLRWDEANRTGRFERPDGSIGTFDPVGGDLAARLRRAQDRIAR